VLPGFVKRIALLAVLTALSGCSERDDRPDVGPQDGVDGGDDGGDRPSSPLRIGSGQTFEIATWNIHNFPSDARTAERVAALIAAMDIDLVAVQEVADVDAFQQMLSALPGHQGVLSTDEYGPGDYQKTGFVYRADMIQIGEVQALFEGDSYAFPRPPLQARFGVTGPGGAAMTFAVITLHLKADSGEDNEARRREACQKLKVHVDGMLAAGIETEIFVVGDFNDRLSDPPEDNVFTAFLDDGQNYEFLSQQIEDDGGYSFIPSNDLLDQVLITKDLLDDYAGGRIVAAPLDLQITDYDYEQAVSDHRPVVAVFPF
jgi:endonuclease/exonuclease/phosphatase family metal-dependent hydrolase